MSVKAVVFLDIDGTLLNEEYKCNDPGIVDVIKQMQSQGFVFCLNSNRSLEDLLPVASKFSIDGLLIGENGIFAYNAASKSTEYLVRPSHLAKFTEHKRNCEEALQQTLSELYGESNVQWHNVNTVDSLTHRPTFAKSINSQVIALNNVFRRYTTSTHILRWKDGKLQHFKKSELQAIVDAMQENVSSKKQRVNISFSETFSNILVTPNEVSKRRAVKKILKNKLYRAGKLFAIGDEIDDFNMIDGLGTFMTVANASNKTKAASAQVADFPQAKGTKQLLEAIRHEVNGQ